MGKRIILMLGIIAVIMTGITGSEASAQTFKQPYLAEQAEGTAPMVRAYLTGNDINVQAGVSGKIGEIDFVSEGGLTRFEDSGEGINYIILLDNSGSVDSKQFGEVKKQLINMRKSLRAQDFMTLYTVGTFSASGSKKDIFGRSVSGSENTKKKDCNKIKKIKYLNSVKSKTVLYRSLNEVLAANSSPNMRTILLLITDGEDDSKGKDINGKSTANEMKNAMIPAYGIILHNKSRHPDKKKMSYTRNRILSEKNCRGYYYDCSLSSGTTSVKNAFKTIDRLLKKRTYIAALKAPNNKVIGKSMLQLTVNNTAIDGVNIDYSSCVEELDAPVIVGDINVIGSKSISFSIQDANGINEADIKDISHYIIRTKTAEDDGKPWVIESLNTETTGNETKITLTFEEEFYTGTYTLGLSDIHDESQNANVMNQVVEFRIEKGLNEKTEKTKSVIKSYWWIALIIIVIAIGLVIILIIRKRPKINVDEDIKEGMKADTKQIRLTITDRVGAIRDVEWNVEGSLFVGRSEMCEISFDDDRLSKQHFVIEVTKMACYVEDLESTNGTFVNGVKLVSRRMLLDGDVITAGREKIVFHIPENRKEKDVGEGSE